MKSKISFFNKTVFCKNITLYWPVWTVYLLALLLLVPGRLWVCLHNMERYYNKELTWNDGLEAIYQSIDIRETIIAVLVMAVVTGMALYNYLYVAKSANMIHALPVTRGELFGTNVIAGLLFMLIPEVIAFFGGVMVCLSFGMTCVEYLGLWLLVMLEVSVFAYAMVCFCAMLTGNLIALPFYFVAINLLYLGVYTVISSVIAYMGYGLYEKSVEEFGFTWLSPAYHLLQNVYFKAHMVYAEGMYECDELVLVGGKSTACYLIPAVFFFLAAYLLYKKRSVEHAGDFVAVSVLKPVFRWGAGFILGFLIARWLVRMMGLVVSYVPREIVLLLALILGIIIFFAAEMLIRKNFKVFTKRLWMECGAFALFMLASSGLMAVKAYTAEHYVPDQDEVVRASIQFTYPLNFDREECGSVLEWHQFIVDHASELEEAAESLDVWYVRIDYWLADGETVSRSYPITFTEDTIALQSYLFAQESEPENFTGYLFGNQEPNMDQYVSGYFELMDSEWNYLGETSFGETEAQLIAEAALADIEAGTLQKYNLPDPSDLAGEGAYASYLVIYGQNNQTLDEDYWETRSAYGGYYYMEEVDSHTIWLNFGRDCENIIDVLIKEGIIESADDLYVPSEVY